MRARFAATLGAEFFGSHIVAISVEGHPEFERPLDGT